MASEWFTQQGVMMGVAIGALTWAGCASYGWADRTEEVAERGGPRHAPMVVGVETVSAEAVHGLDQEAMTGHFQRAIARCGAGVHGVRGAAPEGSRWTSRCHVASLQSEYLGGLVSASASVQCELVDVGAEAARVAGAWRASRVVRMEAPGGPDGALLMRAIAGTDAAIGALDEISCELARAARLVHVPDEDDDDDAPRGVFEQGEY